MNQEFLRRMMWEAHYILKPGTSTSYIWASYAAIEALNDRKAKAEATAALIEKNRSEGFQMLLPFRICFIQEDAAPVAKTGRGAKAKVAQLKASFTRCEESPYKIAKPFKVCTSIWQVEGTKCFFYGTLGVTQAEGESPLDNGDLLILYTAGWKDVDIFLFRGLAKPNEVANLQDVISYVEGLITRG